MHRSRRSSLTGVAHRIAMRLQEVSKPFAERGERAPREMSAREFKTICAEYEDMHSGPLSTSEIQMLAEKFVPRAVGQMARRNQRNMDERITT